MKLLYFDLETTGVKFWENGIHQLSGAVEVDGIIKERFDYKIAPHPNAKIEEEALAVAGVSKEQILAYPKQYDVYSQFLSMLSKYCDKYDKKDKFFLIGYNNASFDNQFLRAFFAQCDDKYFGSWFWSNSIDVMVLAAEYLKHDRPWMIDFKLKTVARQVGIEIEEEKLHDAQYDIDLTMQIYKLITEKPKDGTDHISNEGGDSGSDQGLSTDAP